MDDLLVIGFLLGVPAVITAVWWVYLEADAIRHPDASARYWLEQAEMQRQVNTNFNELLNEVAKPNERTAPNLPENNK